MASIHEETSIQGQQAIQFFPKEHFNIPKSTIQKTKTIITSLNSGIVTDTFKNTASTPYTFVITANNMSVFDLSQCYFNIAGKLKLPNGYHLTDLISLGNLFVASLFQNATLSIGGTDIALNSFPGLDANLQASLKFDNYDLKSFGLADRQFMINDIDYDIKVDKNQVDFAINDFKIVGIRDQTIASGTTNKPLITHRNQYIVYHNDTGVNVSTNCKLAKDIIIKFDDGGNGTMYISGCTIDGDIHEGQNSAAFTLPADSTSTYSNNDVIQNADKNSVILQQDTPITGMIPFRCKLYLSDLFNYTVDSLDYIFNKEISITLTRSSTSNIIANVLSPSSDSSTILEVQEMNKFELIAFSYLLTDTARNQLIQFYNRPVETLYGVQTLNVTPFVQHEKSVEQTITLPMPVTYDTKCILICIPKCSNCLQPLSTPLGAQSEKGSSTAGTYKSSWYMSNSNSYNYGGLRFIRIYNTNNSNIYTYDFSGTKEVITHPTQFLQSFDIANVAAGESIILDYREAYEQYKQLRLLFGKSPDNAIDYWTYLKDYCIIPIDLTGTNIPPNTRIYISLQFDNWNNNYNPLHYGNLSTNQYLSTNIMCVFLGRNVLVYKPDGGCEVKNVLSANPVGKEYKLN